MATNKSNTRVRPQKSIQRSPSSLKSRARSSGPEKRNLRTSLWRIFSSPSRVRFTDRAMGRADKMVSFTGIRTGPSADGRRRYYGVIEWGLSRMAGSALLFSMSGHGKLMVNAGDEYRPVHGDPLLPRLRRKARKKSPNSSDEITASPSLSMSLCGSDASEKTCRRSS